PIQFTYELDECDGRFAPGDDITIYRIVQECLNNILKHSGATEAQIRLRVDAWQARLTIRDNGRGFASDGNGHVGLGLQGIAERARILGGAHTIHSAPGQGTTVTVKIELKGKYRLEGDHNEYPDSNSHCRRPPGLQPGSATDQRAGPATQSRRRTRRRRTGARAFAGHAP